MYMDKLSVRIFLKKSDRNNILNATSFHSNLLINGLPYSRFFRVKRIIKNPQECPLKLKTMTDTFYPEGLYIKEIVRAVVKLEHIA